MLNDYTALASTSSKDSVPDHTETRTTQQALGKIATMTALAETTTTTNIPLPALHRTS